MKLDHNILEGVFQVSDHNKVANYFIAEVEGSKLKFGVWCQQKSYDEYALPRGWEV